ncbi:MAG: DUF1838 family protein [Gammaproteobacteria bacterium]
MQSSYSPWRSRSVAGLMLALAGILVAVLPAAASFAAAPDLSTAEGQLKALRKIQCSQTDGKPVTFYWNGMMFSRVPGEADRMLFKVEGMNIRQCGPLAGATNPAEFRLVSREILLYEDPVTGEVLQTWTNPWTGKTVDVIQIANDPVNGNYGLKGRDGKPVNLPFGSSGNQWWLTLAVPLFYTNPLAGDYQRYVGGTYHATELFNFFGSIDALGNSKQDSVPTAVGWERISGWLPWMEMGDRAGIIYFHTAGRKLDKWDDLSSTMKAQIEKNYPAYRNPPPLDDKRPNETSWTYFKKVIDEHNKTAGGK